MNQLGNDIRILNTDLERGRIRHAIFDFDGTISIMREGWEKIMEPVMIESICGTHEPTEEIVQAVRDYIDKTTGIQTIFQMEGLVKMVKQYGLVPEQNILDAWGYKRIYNERLMIPVQKRIALITSGRKTVKDFMLKGALDFVKKLHKKEVVMYLASGTDREDVQNEASHLGVDHYFRGGIYGAIRPVENYSKDKVMKDILSSHDLHGSELVVFGDGPVEIKNAKSNGAIAVGVASDEVKGSGWNKRKIERLREAGCDILVPDFTKGDLLLEYLFYNKKQV